MIDPLIEALNAVLLAGARSRRRLPPPRALDELGALVRQSEERAQERFVGCGWFDSSHDLRQGLRVREHEAASAELPLWLELHLAEWRGTGAAG